MIVTTKIPESVLDALDSDKTTLSPVQVGQILGVSDQTVRAMADAGQLDFPVFRHRTWLRIPKIPFLKWLGYDVLFEKEYQNEK